MAAHSPVTRQLPAAPRHPLARSRAGGRGPLKGPRTARRAPLPAARRPPGSCALPLRPGAGRASRKRRGGGFRETLHARPAAAALRGTERRGSAPPGGPACLERRPRPEEARGYSAHPRLPGRSSDRGGGGGIGYSRMPGSPSCSGALAAPLVAGRSQPSRVPSGAFKADPAPGRAAAR